MKQRLLTGALWGFTVLWMALIFSLSTQNGTKTAETSGEAAQTTAKIIYETPTEEQIHKVDFSMRKAAHVVLFLVLGVGMGASVLATRSKPPGRKNRRISLGIAAAATCLYGFFDEWHKQFIDGRHFDAGETAMNIAAGIVGAALIGAAIAIHYYIMRKRADSKLAQG